MFGRRKPTSRATLIQTPHLPRVARVRGVAWSILGGSGPLDSGSNPDGPIHQVSRRSLVPFESTPSVRNESRYPTYRSPNIGATSTLGGADGNVAHHAPASIGDGPERHRSRTEEKHEESRRASSGEVVAVGRPVVDVREGVRRVILIEQRDPRGAERRDIEDARGEPGILHQNGNVRRGRDVVKRPGHRNRRQQVLIGKGSRRDGPDAHRHKSDGRKAMEAVDPLSQGSLPQDLPPLEVAENSCGQSWKD